MDGRWVGVEVFDGIRWWGYWCVSFPIELGMGQVPCVDGRWVGAEVFDGIRWWGNWCVSFPIELGMGASALHGWALGWCGGF